MPDRRQLAHIGAPFAFLLGVTIAVVLIHSGLQSGGTPATTLRSVAQITTTRASKSAKTATSARTGTVAAGPRYYTVKKGDTFGAIAAAEGTTVAALEALNPGVSSNSLSVGQKIRVK